MHVVNCDNFEKCLDVMKEELKSMELNNVWNLVELLEGRKRVGSKLVFRTKHDFHSNLECYKVILVSQGYT